MQSMRHREYVFFRFYSVASLIMGLLLTSCEREVREISQKRFMHMVISREIQQVRIVNGNVVEVWLKPNVTMNDPYNSLFKDYDPEEPHFRMPIASEKVFRQNLAKANPKFRIITEERTF